MSIIALSSCAAVTPKTVYVDKDIPVYVVPKPPAIIKPVLAIDLLTVAQQDDIGELTKAYSISLKQAMQYACQLKNVVDKYDDLSAKNPTLITPAPTPVDFSLTTVAPSLLLNVDVTKDCTKQ